MLQWMPPNYDNKLIYNKRIKNKFCSVIFDINKKTKEVILFPIYSVHPSGKFALTLNFSRLNNTRKGYGYEGTKDEFQDENIPKKDAILRVLKFVLILSMKVLEEFLN